MNINRLEATIAQGIASIATAGPALGVETLDLIDKTQRQSRHILTVPACCSSKRMQADDHVKV